MSDMIDIEHYKRILDSGLLLDHYLVLCKLRDGGDLPKNKRVQGFINLLNKKGYIEEGVLTELASTLLLEGKIISTGRVVRAEEGTDFHKWVIGLHKRCQDRIQELTGSKQVRPKIEGKPYPFMPNATDFFKVLYKVVVLYKIKDLEKVERCLMRHIDTCNQTRKWYPLMKYYIMKFDSSSMVTDLEGLDDEKEIGDSKSLQKFV